MADIETIGIALETGGIEKGIKSLDDLASRGPKVEKAMKGVADAVGDAGKSAASIGGASTGFQKVGDAAAGAEKKLKAYRDANGRLRDENGRFVSSANAAAYAVQSFGQSAGDAAEKIRKTGDSASRASGGVGSLSLSLSGLTKILGTIGVAALAKQFIDVADAMSLLDARLKLSTSGTQEFQAAQAALFQMAQANAIGLAETTTLYTKLADPVKALGGGMDEVIAITNTFQQSLKLSGASATEAANATLQFGQALAAGALSGDEFKSLAENAPKFMKVLAEGIGVPVAELKKMGSEGKLTAEVVGNALLKMSEDVAKEFATLPNTVGGEMTRLETDIKKAVQRINEQSGLTLGVADLIAEVRKLIPTIEQELGGAFASVGAFIQNNKAELQGVWNTVVGIVGDVWDMAKAAGSVLGFVTDWAVSTGAAKTVLESIRLILAGLQDGVRILGATFAKVGSTIIKAVMSPLSAMLEALGKAQGFFNLGDGGAALNSMANAMRNFGQEGSKYAAQVFDDFSKGKTQVAALAAELNKTAEATKASSTGAAQAGKVHKQLAAAINEAGENAKKAGANKKKAAEDGLQAAEREIASIQQRIKQEEALLARVREYGVNAAKLTEGEKLAIKIQEELNGKLSDKVRAQKEAALEAAKQLTTVEKLRAAEEAYAKALDESIKKQIQSAQAFAQQREALERQIRGVGKSETELFALDLADDRRAYEQAADSGSFDPKYLEAWLQKLREGEEVLRRMVKLDFTKAAYTADETTRSLKEALKYSEEDKDLVLMTAKQREKVIALRKVERDLAEEIRKIDLMAISEEEKALLRGKARTNAELRQQIELNNIVQEEWRQTAETIEQSLTDALMRGFESGKGFAENLRDTLKNMFNTLVLRPIISAIVQPIGNVISGMVSGITGNLAGGLTGGAGGVMSGFNGLGSIGSLLGGLGNFGGGLAAGWGGLMGSLGFGGTGATLGGALSAGTTALGMGNIAGGLGTIAGALGPIALGVGAIMSLISSLDGSGDPHSGAFASYSAANGLRTDKDPELLGMGQGWGPRDYNSDIAPGVNDLARAIATSLDGFARSFGSAGGYEVTTGWADDFDGEGGSWGGLRITRNGEVVRDWTEGEWDSKWAPREFKPQEEGYEEYLNAVAQEMRSVLMDMDLPGWAESMLNDVGDTATVEQIAQVMTQIGQIKQTFETLGQSMQMFAGISDEMQTALMAAAGGIEALSASATTFYQGFYTQEEQMAQMRASLRQQMDDLGFEDFDLLAGDVKARFRELVEAQMALGEEAAPTAAALLALAGNLATLVDTAEQTALQAANLSVDSMVNGFIGEINAGRGATAGVWLADSIAAGFEQAIYGQAMSIVMNAIIDGVITPVVTAAITGTSVSEAVSGAAIDAMVANAQAAASALTALLSNDAFNAAIGDVLNVVRDLGNTIGASIPVMSSYKRSMSSVSSSVRSAGSAADSAANSASKLANAWTSLIDSLSDEIKRLRGELVGVTGDSGAAYYESMFAIRTAQARAGDQDAAEELPQIIQQLEEIAKGTASSQADVLLKQSAWLASLSETRDMLARKYGVDISKTKVAEGVRSGASGASDVTATVTYAQDVAIKNLQSEVAKLRSDLRSGFEAMVSPTASMSKVINKWERDGLPEERS